MNRRYVSSVITVLMLLLPGSASAILSSDQDALDNDTIHYIADDNCTTAAASSSAVGASPADVKAREQVIWDFLTAAGHLTPAQAAGVMANIAVESAHTFDPTIVQGGGHSSDPGSISNGYGIVQWTPGSKLLAYADIKATPANGANLTRQLNVLWDQLTNPSSPLNENAAGKALLATSTPEEAAAAFMLKFERPADQSASAVAGRSALAAPFLVEFGGGGAGSSAVAAGTPTTAIINSTTAASATGCPSTNSASSAVTGPGCDSQTATALATAILANDNITKDGRLVREDLNDAAAGKVSSAGTKLSQSLLCVLYSMGKNHKFFITALESGGTGHAANSLHYSGQAVDFGTFDGATVTGRDSYSIALLTALFSTPGVSFSGAGIGQSQCGGQSPTLPAGVTQFEDTCNHVHFQFSRDAP